MERFKTNKRKKSRLIVDATPVECDINIIKKYVTPERLEKLDLDFGYSTTEGHYIGFKVIVVLEEDSLCPISVLIHSGAKHDSVIFDEILKELKRRRLLKKEQVLLIAVCAEKGENRSYSPAMHPRYSFHSSACTP